MSSSHKTERPSGPHAIEDLGHGHSTAAWAAVGVALVGFTVGTVAVFLLNWPLFWVGAVIVLLSLVVGRVLSMAGFGEYSRGGGDSPTDKPESLGVQ